MNGNTQQDPPPHYPTLASPSREEPTLHAPPPSAPPPSNSHEAPPPPPGPSSYPPPESDEKWGTHLMGAPAVPTCHPNNQKAALWNGGGSGSGGGDQQHHHPYLQYTPVEKPSSSPMESVLQKFNSWSSKAETTAHNIWHNLKTGPSVSGSAWAKVNLRAKALTGGGFESLYKQTFTTLPNEKLNKTFASYLSTSTGPVAGTLYLSNLHLAFCSDRPLSFTAPSGQESWSYYKVMVPMGNIGSANPVTMRDNISEKYIHIITIDGHDFWFMGFVNYDKATHHLLQAISTFAASGIPLQPKTQH